MRPFDTNHRDSVLAQLRPWVEKAQIFSGWDFPDVRVQHVDQGPPWDFEETVRVRAAGCRAVLDLGTGGGERLASLRPDLPERVVATEEWAVNAPIASRRLTPLGVRVVRAKSARLPFQSPSFDLVIDRHEEFNPAEVDRILVPGGSFVTQQVGQHDWRELRPFFPRMTDFGDQRSNYGTSFRRLGFLVESVEHDHRVAYPSLGAFVFMLLVAPWTIPDFDVARDLDALVSFESEHGTREGLVVTECRYLIVARKPR